MQVGDLVRYRFTGKIGIIVKQKIKFQSTLLYVEWINNEDNGWISAMNLEVVA